MPQLIKHVTTCCQSVFDNAVRTPDKPAIITSHRILTYGAVRQRTAAVAAALMRRGIKPGEKVAIGTASSTQHLIAVLAVMAVGGVAVPLPNSAPDAAEIVSDCSPVLIILCTGETGPKNVAERVELEILEADGSGASFGAAPHRPMPGDLAMIYYTSGTSSGIRKGVLQSHGQLEATAQYISELMQVNDRIREFIATPTDNAFWFGRCRVVLRAGGTAVLTEGTFNPLRITADMALHHCNSIAGDTPVFVMLLRHFEKQLTAIGPSLLWAKVASQAMTTEDKRRLSEFLPNARLVMNYGLTEAMRCCILPFHDHPDKLDSVGRPCPGVNIRIVDDNDVPLMQGELGEVQVSGVNLASGYLNKEEMWHERFRDGWYATNDLGYLDVDGFLHITGRKDEAINVGGRTVAPAEVETSLRDYVSNTVYCICGRKDPSNLLGEVPVLCVEGEWREAVSWRNMRIAMLKGVPKALVPRLAVVVPEFPTTSNGKVQRGLLRERIEADAYPYL